MQLLFDSNVRHHLAADFAESIQPISDLQEAILIDRSDIARVIPSILQDLCRFLRPAQIALHDVWSADEQYSGLADIQVRSIGGVRVDDPDTYSRDWMSNFASLASDLAKAGRAEVMSVHGHHGRTLGAAVTLEWPNAKLLLESGGQSLGQFFGTGHHHAQAA